MKRVRRVFMPLWVAWFAQAFLLPVWGFVTYRTFFAARNDVSMAGWTLVTVFCVVISAMLLLMGYRKLPVQIIEEIEEEDT